MTAIEVHDLHKHYGDNRAVDGLSFDVRPGEVYALLGENGAGKSTTVEILEGHRTATSGTIRVLGVDPADADRGFRDRIGIVLQSARVEDEFTVREILELYAASYRTPRDVGDVIELVEMGEKADARVGSLSGGQKRRVDLAIGIIGRPELLFLDEPTTGFDPSARRRAWDLVNGLREEGTTVLLTTHYLDEAEFLAGRVGVLHAGRMIAEGSPADLIDAVSGTRVSFELPASVAPAEAAAVFGPLLGADVRLTGNVVETTVAEATQAVHRVTGWAVDAGVELHGLSVTRAGLEEVYLELARNRAELS